MGWLKLALTHQVSAACNERFAHGSPSFYRLRDAACEQMTTHLGQSAPRFGEAPPGGPPKHPPTSFFGKHQTISSYGEYFVLVRGTFISLQFRPFLGTCEEYFVIPVKSLKPARPAVTPFCPCFSSFPRQNSPGGPTTRLIALGQRGRCNKSDSWLVNGTMLQWLQPFSPKQHTWRLTF